MADGCPRSLTGVHVPDRNNRLNCRVCGGRLSATQARDDAMRRVADHADPAFAQTVIDIIHALCVSSATFNADDIWAAMPRGIVTHDNRALGPMLEAARKEGWCQPTMEHRSTTRASNHARPIRMWKSLLHA